MSELKRIPYWVLREDKEDGDIFEDGSEMKLVETGIVIEGYENGAFISLRVPDKDSPIV